MGQELAQHMGEALRRSGGRIEERRRIAARTPAGEENISGRRYIWCVIKRVYRGLIRSVCGERQQIVTFVLTHGANEVKATGFRVVVNTLLERGRKCDRGQRCQSRRKVFDGIATHMSLNKATWRVEQLGNRILIGGIGRECQQVIPLHHGHRAREL